MNFTSALLQYNKGKVIRRESWDYTEKGLCNKYDNRIHLIDLTDLFSDDWVVSNDEVFVCIDLNKK